MSSRKSDILEVARRQFNQHGIDKVTTRDIARELNISQGNLTYYFPSKSDIIEALIFELLAHVDNALAQHSGKPVENMLVNYVNQVEVIFKAHFKYKFIFPRYGELLSSLPAVQPVFHHMQRGRVDFWHELNKQLVKERLAKPSLLEDSFGHCYVINHLAIYWHQEFDIFLPELTDEQRVQKAKAIFMQAYKPYLTKKGWDSIAPMLEKLEHY